MALFFNCASLFGQRSYNDSLQGYLHAYVTTHEVVKGDDKKYFRFFPIDENYRVVAEFQRTSESRWFLLETSGQQRKLYRVFGTISFIIHDTLLKLNLYQSKALLTDPNHQDYLLLMFRDKTTGDETYEAGRYVDLSIGEIKNNRIAIDFNKSYNTYCAYVRDKYNCPIPPRENDLPVAIRAGEKSYEKKAE